MWTPSRILTLGRSTPSAFGKDVSYRSKYTKVTVPTVQTYAEAIKESMTTPELFWEKAANKLTWFTKYEKVYQSQNYPRSKWFPGGELNMCYNCLDRHVEDRRGDQVAIIYDSPITQTLRKITYSECLNEVSKLAAQLVSMGVHSGDRVIIYMPMIPEAMFAMLACARIGAVHSVVFGGFAAKELGSRIRHAQPKVIISANCGIEPNKIIWYKKIVDEAVRFADLPENVYCLIYQRPNFEPAPLKISRDVEWNEVIPRHLKGHDCVKLPSDHPLYILYTSGTTGFPKGVVRSTASHAVVLPWTLKFVFGMARSEVWWAASDLGWVVGHSYILYGPLLSRLTTVLYEGKPVGTPDAKQFHRVLEDHGVHSMFVAPSALRAIRKEDLNGNISTQVKPPKLRNIFVAGEHCDTDTKNWGKKTFKVPVYDNWWQTETGHPIAATCVAYRQDNNTPDGSCGKPVPGYEISILREDGQPCIANELGRVVCKHPMPPGFMETLYGSDELFKAQYFQRFPGYYDTMDAGYIDPEGYVYVVARDDDVINVAGHRISTAALEEVILDHPDVIDTAVVGVVDYSKGQVPLCLFVLRKDSTRDPEVVSEELIEKVRDRIGPVAAFKYAVAVPALPRTRSGKTPRKSLADLASNKSCQIPPTIEDASVYEDIQHILKKLGLAKEAVIKF